MARPRAPVLAAVVAAFVAALPRPAGATGGVVFGVGPRSASLASSDVADAGPVFAAYGSPALVAASGTHVAIGYRATRARLLIDDLVVPVADMSGTEMGAQVGGGVGRGVVLGGGATLWLPNASFAPVGFRPGSEPQFPLYDYAPQRAGWDFAFAGRAGPVSIGAGVTALVNAETRRLDFKLGQDAGGTYSDSRIDVSLPYRISPIAGAHVDLGRAALAARYRGPMALGVEASTATTVALVTNPLNGDVRVHLVSVAGYEPASVAIAGRADVPGGLRALVSVEYLRWSAMPPPAAEVELDVRLGAVPGEKLVKFVEPRMRDTMNLRTGLEWKPRADPDPGAPGGLALRAGYALSPSPVPAQRGWTTWADGDRHTFAAGAGWDFGRVWGVGLAVQAAGQAHVLASRSEDKPSDALPNAHYRSSGTILAASGAVEATWK